VVEHFFRHEYGRLVATLSCRVGVHLIEDVEDAVQSALMTALETWTTGGLPDNPPAWLFRVAYNHLMGESVQFLKLFNGLTQNRSRMLAILHIYVGVFTARLEENAELAQSLWK
jgi:hypothetical protein